MLVDEENRRYYKQQVPLSLCVPPRPGSCIYNCANRNSDYFVKTISSGYLLILFFFIDPRTNIAKYNRSSPIHFSFRNYCVAIRTGNRSMAKASVTAFIFAFVSYDRENFPAAKIVRFFMSVNFDQIEQIMVLEF